MMGHHHHRYILLKFVVVCIFLFIAFWYGVQIGEIKGALGMTPFGSHERGGMMMQANMMGGNGGWTAPATGTMPATGTTTGTTTAQ